MPRKPVVLRSSAALFALLALGALVFGTWRYAHGAAGETSVEQPGVAAGEDSGNQLHPVRIRPGPPTPRVMATLPGTGGVPAMVSCSTCHATRRPDLTNASAGAMDEFHQGLKYQHGGLTCLSCHNAGNYDTLRRADGTALQYPDTIQLCAQCHGPQYRDYLNGSHGGMTGHWDLRVGERVRNTCTDCHDVHAPAFPQVQPVFPPQDRGARQLRERAAAHASENSPHVHQH